MSAQSTRTRGDMCPGVLRPWLADDGLLVRLRLIGGHLSGAQLRALLDVAERFGDGGIHVTSRANLQVRGLTPSGELPEEVVAAFEATGLLPSRRHELIRNVLVSPQTGLAGGRADLRPIARELDQRLLADPHLGDLPGRFLFVLDDGRGDLIGRQGDLGLVAVDGERGQLRVGDGWGPICLLGEAAGSMVELARGFLTARGAGSAAPWHVRELAQPLTSGHVPDSSLPPPSEPMPYGLVPGGRHVEIPDGLLTRSSASDFFDEPVLIVTPWHGVFVPSSTENS